MSAAKTPTFTVRHLHLARALFAAMAAVMVTFTGDHSASLGLAAFSGFAVASGLVWALSTWLIYPATRRAPAVLLALVSVSTGIVAGVPMARTTTMFFVLVITWAVLTAIIEGVTGWRGRKGEFATEAKESFAVGIITAVLAIATILVQPTYALSYFNAALNEGGTLTGITIAVGIFGAYAAIIAVYLAIAGFSPKVETSEAAQPATDESASAQEVAS